VIGHKGILYLKNRNTRDGVDDSYLVEILRSANMYYNLKQRGGLDVRQKWSEILSPGEQQRIMFARLFYHKLSLVLDEASSALDAQNEAQCTKSVPTRHHVD